MIVCVSKCKSASVFVCACVRNGALENVRASERKQRTRTDNASIYRCDACFDDRIAGTFGCSLLLVL